METHIHQFEPVYNQNSHILILGTFPSIKSRETHFYYGHPQNRFWKVLAAILKSPIPSSITKLPSTSPANASYSLERLTKEWCCIQKNVPEAFHASGTSQ